MLRVSVYSSRELLTVIRGLRNLDRETKKQLRAHLRPMVTQAWREALAARANTDLERRVLVDTARVKVSDQNVRLTSATLSRSLTGGLKPSAHYGPVEFGAARLERTTSRGRRNVHAPFKQPNRRGYVVYPAAAAVIPRVLAMYVQTYARAIHEALEGKSS
jgi:hypothetical protein